jgi:putative transposase
MGLPRSKYVQEGQEGVYHCFSRCVRRAFLYGFDPLTRQDFSHRKAWIVDRLRHLAAIFAIEVCAYAVMVNHYHTILRTRPDIVAGWSDQEVAIRWLTLFPRHDGSQDAEESLSEKQIYALTSCPERIAELRRRLCSLSWFMGRLNEFIARAANKEDHVKGRFWESRFKCQSLLDDAAIAACMVYVDLNPVRSGLAAIPEESDFTSIQERIRAWQKKSTTTVSVPTNALQDASEFSGPVPRPIYATDNFPGGTACSNDWLCPISSEPHRRGILQMTAAEYFDLVDRSGRIIRADKHGVIDADIAPILLRIGAKPEAWIETISQFGCRFRLAAGLVSNLREFAQHLGRRWLTGLAAAKASFASSPPQLACAWMRYQSRI